MANSYGLTMKGKLVIEKVSSLPAWSASDEGRLVYNTTDKELYMGSNIQWEMKESAGYGAANNSFSDNDTLTPGTIYFIDTSVESLTGILPLNPTAGQLVTVVDNTSNFQVNPFYISGNGKTIMGESSVTLDLKDSINDIIYNGTEWRLNYGGTQETTGGYTHPTTHPPSIIAQDSDNRFFTDTERNKLSDIEAEANNYEHPVGHPASIITSGTIDIERLPASAIERLHIVSNQTARFLLTTGDVQEGDTVKQEDTGTMYRIVDDTKLDQSDGYVEYSAARAAAVDWSGVENKPSTFTPSDHSIAGSIHTNSTISQLNSKISDATLIDTGDSRLSDDRTPLSHDNTKHSTNYAEESITITAGTGLSGGGDLSNNRTLAVDYGTAPDTACEGNDSRLSDARTPTSHTHGNIENSGAIGTTSGLLVETTTSGVLTTKSAGTISQFLRGDNTWATVDGLPDQTGNDGKYLTTNGTSASWAAVTQPDEDQIRKTTVSAEFPDGGNDGEIWLQLS